MSNSPEKKRTTGRSASAARLAQPSSDKRPKRHTLPYQAGPGQVLAPMVAVKITAPTGLSITDAALIDTGADVSGFPLDWMRRLGVRRSDCQKKPLETAAGLGEQLVYPGGVKAVVLGCEMRLEAVFADSPVALLGREDFLSHFKVAFDQRAFKFTLQLYAN